MDRAVTGKPPGWALAIAAAGVAVATAAIYVALIATQGTEEVGSVAAIAVFLVALGACALGGAIRRTPDRVIPLGAATGGLVGAGILSLFSIGALLLVAGVLSLLAWVRAGVEASPRHELIAGLAALAAAVGFLLLAIAA